MMRRYPLVLCCLLLSVFARAEQTNDTVEILFVPLGETLSVFPDDGKSLKQKLVDGQAEFVSLSQLPKSEYYVGYRLMASLAEVESFPGESLSLTLWAADFKGFLELDSEKLTPMITANVERFMLQRANRNKGWVYLELPEPMVSRLFVGTFKQRMQVGAKGQPERWEEVSVAGEQRGAMLFVRWSGVVEESVEQVQPQSASPVRLRRLRMGDGVQPEQQPQRPQRPVRVEQAQ